MRGGKHREKLTMATASKTARDFLAEITTAIKRRPMAAIVYGPPGIGKSSLGAAIPGRVFLIDDQEEGIHTLKSGGLVAADVPVLPPARTWEDTLEVVRQLGESKHDYKALVVDTLGGLERLCHEFVCRTEFGGNWGDKGFASYQKGFEVALPEWRNLLNGFDRCRDNGMSVMCLAHSLVKTHKNPEGEDYDRYVPDLHHKTWSLTHRWADMVLFLNYYVIVTEDSKKQSKARGGQQRTMYTEYHAAYEAKNRSSLPSEIEMGDTGKSAWENLREALKGGKKK